MQVRRLTITADEKDLVDITFSINRSLALVGQSGSGKSLTLKALLGMLPKGVEAAMDIVAPFELVCGKTVALVPQNPFTALSPLTKIKHQFFLGKARLDALLALVGLDAELAERFPPELSGGQLQRIVIAMALGSDPKLLLLDEPTTALDQQTRQSIMELLTRLREELGFEMLFVTHDMESARQLCEEICVIREGRVVESGAMDAVLASPASDYTRMLIEANFTNREFRV